jgi:hypothetical protein
MDPFPRKLDYAQPIASQSHTVDSHLITTNPLLVAMLLIVSLLAVIPAFELSQQVTLTSTARPASY